MYFTHLNATYNQPVNLQLKYKISVRDFDLVAQFLTSNAADSYQFPPLGGRSVTGEAALLWFIGWRAVEAIHTSAE